LPGSGRLPGGPGERVPIIGGLDVGGVVGRVVGVVTDDPDRP